MVPTGWWLPTLVTSFVLVSSECFEWNVFFLTSIGQTLISFTYTAISQYFLFIFIIHKTDISRILDTFVYCSFVTVLGDTDTAAPHAKICACGSFLLFKVRRPRISLVIRLFHRNTERSQRTKACKTIVCSIAIYFNCIAGFLPVHTLYSHHTVLLLKLLPWDKLFICTNGRPLKHDRPSLSRPHYRTVLVDLDLL